MSAYGEEMIDQDSGGCGDLDVRRLNERLRWLARQYARVASEVLGENLTSVYLFGSVARGQAGPESDIDLLVICPHLPEGAFRRRRMLEPIRERLTLHLQKLWDRGVYTDFVEVIRDETEAAKVHPLYLDMVNEAVCLFDRNDFFTHVLARLAERLQALGAERRHLGRVRYWDLKPDFRAGEVIEL